MSERIKKKNEFNISKQFDEAVIIFRGKGVELVFYAKPASKARSWQSSQASKQVVHVGKSLPERYETSQSLLYWSQVLELVAQLDCLPVLRVKGTLHFLKLRSPTKMSQIRYI